MTARHNVLAAHAAAALIAAALGAAGAAPPASAAAHAPIALGVSVADPGKPAALDGYVDATGRSPSIVMWSQSFDEPLYYPDQLPAVHARDAVPMITWEPSHGDRGIPLRSIADGAEDAYLKRAAAAALRWGKPLFIRFGHEMNLTSSPWGPGVEGNTPADFVAAWRHVVTVFRQAGASNVDWVWSPNTDPEGTYPFDAFYPGDRWVDWVGLDGYNYASVDGVPWMSMTQIFGSSYDDLARLSSKPIMIAETASTELGGDKAAWITQGLLQDVPHRLPAVRAVIWWQRDKETDWRVNSSAAALAAYRTVATSPLYAGTVANLVPTSGTPALHRWPTAIPRWFWSWARWRRHGAVPAARPSAAPARVPRWTWIRLRAL